MTLTATRRSSTNAGSCNYCSRWLTAAGMTPHPVTELGSDDPNGSVLVRLCDDCLDQLRSVIVPAAEIETTPAQARIAKCFPADVWPALMAAMDALKSLAEDCLDGNVAPDVEQVRFVELCTSVGPEYIAHLTEYYEGFKEVRAASARCLDPNCSKRRCNLHRGTR